MQTIFITSFHPYISRNILQTDVLRILADSGDRRIVILVHEYKVRYYEAEFGRPNVIVEGVATGGGAGDARGLVFKRIARAMLNTRSAQIQKRWKLASDGDIFYFLASYGVALLGTLPLTRRAARFLDARCAPYAKFKPLFETHRPSLLVSTDVQNENDVRFLQAAQHFGVPTIAMVRSWDNLTSHQGIVRIIPDLFLVPTEIVRREAIRYHDVPPSRITIVGIPHRDRYVHFSPRESREEFLLRLGLDPAKKLILFSPFADRYSGQTGINECVLEVLCSSVDANVIVRFVPADAVTLRAFKPSPRMVFDRPGVVFNATTTGDRDISPQDEERLIYELFYSDLVISLASTIVIDAAFFEKPVICVAFSPQPVSYWHGVEKFYDYDHFANVVRTGGLRLARSLEELRQWIRIYLDDPTRDRAERRKIVSEQCGQIDGQASQRLALLILQHLPHG